MSAFGKCQAHESSSRREQSRVDGKVSWTARESLYIDSPLFWVQSEGLQGTTLGKKLDLVDELIAAIVASTGVPLRVLVCQAGTLHLQCVARSEVL